jgi:thioredoxin-like negative regulator of GroEL
MIELLLAAERFLEAGMPDRAGRLFEQVAEADPRNAIAVVGLARVAVARGDDSGAAVLARRALEIDPDDPAAAHLLESLSRAPLAQPEAAGEAAGEPRPLPAPARRSWLQRLFAYLRGR